MCLKHSQRHNDSVKSHTLSRVTSWTHSGKPEDPSVDPLPPYGFPLETVNLEENIALIDVATLPQ